MRVGLTGGIGAGKSAVADVWRERGALIVDADAIAHEVVAPGTPAQREIAAAWPQVVRSDGTIDRPALAAIIFSDPAARARLNAIVHPRVRAQADERERAAPGGSTVVHVVPLLFEGDYWRSCDATVVVIAPRAERIARVGARDGLPREAIERRMDAQIDPEAARARATFAIDNDADLAALRDRANAVYDQLTARG